MNQGLKESEIRIPKPFLRVNIAKKDREKKNRIKWNKSVIISNQDCTDE